MSDYGIAALLDRGLDAPPLDALSRGGSHSKDAASDQRASLGTTTLDVGGLLTPCEGGGEPVGRKGHHHVVPKFYLRGFANENELIIRRPLAPSADSTVRPVGIGAAMVRTDFYKVESESVHPDAFEDELSKVESHTAPAFERVINGQGPMSIDDRGRVASWIALQYLRSEASRRMGEELYRAINKLEVSIATPAVAPTSAYRR